MVPRPEPELPGPPAETRPAEIIPDAIPADRPDPALGASVRAALVAVAAGSVLVFATAVWLNPYEPDGTPRRLETHRQLGLPPCNFKVLTGYPCPSCGMTTSFSLLMHGDLVNSLRANAVGTVLACCWLAFIPWSVASAWRGRAFGVRSIEQSMTLAAIAFVILMMVRWVFVVAAALAGW